MRPARTAPSVRSPPPDDLKSGNSRLPEGLRLPRRRLISEDVDPVDGAGVRVTHLLVCRKSKELLTYKLKHVPDF